MRPAPITSTRRPLRSPNTCAASAAAADETDAGLSPIAVSVRTRLPTDSACRKTRSSSEPGLPPPRTRRAPGRGSRLHRGRASRGRRRLGRDAARPRRRAGDRARRRAARLRAPRARPPPRSSPSPARYSSVRLQVERQTASPSACASAVAAGRSSVTRSRNSTGATWCERPTSVRVAHEKCVPASASRATMTRTKPPSARYAARRPDGRSEDDAAVEQPRGDRQDLERVE